MSTIAELKHLKGILADPKQWCKGAISRNVDGEPVGALSGAARQWSLLGATQLVVNSNDHARTPLTKTLRSKLKKRYMDLLVFNECPYTCHKDIIDLIDDAIAAQFDEKGLL